MSAHTKPLIGGRERVDRILNLSHGELILFAQDMERGRDDLLAALEKMNRAYVNLMEGGRDRIIDLGVECDPVDVMERGDPNLQLSRATIAKVRGAA